MSHHNYTKENPPVVNRNEINKSLEPSTFGKTSPNKGQTFWTINVRPELDDIISAVKFAGLTISAGIFTRAFRKVAIDISTAEKNRLTDGTFDWSSALEDWASFDTGGATLSDLNEEIGLLQDQAAEITDVMEEEGLYDDNGEVLPDKQPRFNVLSTELKEITNKIRPIKREIKRIQEKYALIAAKRAATKEAKAS